MFNKFFANARKPQGWGGRFFASGMNIGHSGVSRWGLKHLAIKPADHILDIGCGGGINVARMLKRAPEGRVCGLDYSEVSVKKTGRVNAGAVRAGRSEIRLGSVSENPWPDNSFDIVTAFETVYFWPDFVHDLGEVRRVLKPGGVFFICNELNKPEGGETPGQYWIKTLGIKVYGPAEFRNYLTEAGFVEINIAAEGKGRICVSALAKKGREG
jgi:ubiquinone/menaquinone biosynthesis C-methylase UbiE